jgi:tetratricopeptide (TPR) repeat protein
MKIANFKLQIAKVKILHFTFYILPFAFLLLSGCVAYQVGGEIQPGRYALLRGDSKAALAHFQRAAETDPNHVNVYTGFREGVWTYVGRAHYALGEFSAARQALERARRNEEDHMAKLYLGLVLARNGDKQRGIKEIEAGLKGLGDSLEYADQYSLDGRYWDPGRDLRSQIQKDLAMISGKDLNLPQLIAGGEWLGVELEQEIDESRRQRRNERRDSAKGDGKGD